VYELPQIVFKHGHTFDNINLMDDLVVFKVSLELTLVQVIGCQMELNIMVDTLLKILISTELNW
jgi:hypothetical protein